MIAAFYFNIHVLHSPLRHGFYPLSGNEHRHEIVLVALQNENRKVSDGVEDLIPRRRDRRRGRGDGRDARVKYFIRRASRARVRGAHPRTHRGER